MNKPFVIRDPVHGYLRVAAHERIVIDHPITQRLRRITQTGLAEFVFPEARTSRFVHSLGAMHLASRFLISAVENADEPTALAFFAELEALDVFNNYNVQLDDLELLLVPDRRFGGGGLEATRVTFHDTTLRNDRKFVRLLGLAEAGLRLAALFHDLGHLPFSHDFEFALKDYAAQSPDIAQNLESLAAGTPHEKIGHRLADLVFQALIKDQKEISAATRVSFAMVRKILDTEPGYDDFLEPNVNALGWLHSLVDGEIDVDRADYLLRDARALGLEFAAYDLDRLVRNLVLVRHRTLGYITAVDERGLTAVESFYISRARSHQVLARHHKSAQLGAALRYSSVNALGSKAGSDFLAELNELQGARSAKQAKDLLTQFAEHDDPWWLQILRACEQKSEAYAGLLQATTSLILRREPTLKSLWKRKGDLSKSQIARLNRLFRSPEYGPLIQQVRRELAKKGVLLVLHKFRPYGITLGGNPKRDSITLIQSDNRFIPVVQLSPLIRALRDAWDEDLQIHAFALRSSDVTKEQVLESLLSPPKPKQRRKQRKGSSGSVRH